MKVPILRVKLSDEAIREVSDTLRTGFLAEGVKTKEFEKKFAEYVGVRHAITVPNGTLALQLAIKSLKLGSGEIITTPFTFIASANSILYNGLKPVFADVNPETFNLDPESVAERITSKTKAVMPVHLFGQPCEMQAFLELCEDNDLYLIEDAAQAHGADFRGRKTGSMGEVGCFSFYATKNLTTGEGGMITTDSDQVARRVRFYKNHGQVDKYEHSTIGYNYRMNDVLSSIGLKELGFLDENNAKRASYAERMNAELRGVKTPVSLQECRHVYHQYVIKTDSRDKLQKHLLKRGVGTAVHYPLPVYLQETYKKLGYKEDLRNVQAVADQVLSLPVHHHLTEEEVDYVIKSVNDFEK